MVKFNKTVAKIAPNSKRSRMVLSSRTGHWAIVDNKENYIKLILKEFKYIHSKPLPL